MDPQLFLRGLIIGFAIAAPVGPIGILCIRRSLAGGFPLGFLTGLGAAAADGVYGAAAAFGLTAISAFLVTQQGWLRLFGGLGLVALGVHTALKRPASEAAPPGAESLPGAFFSTFMLTIANPATIVSFAAVFAGLGLGDAAWSGGDAATVVLGVFLGSGTWWLMLAGATASFRRQVPGRALQWINRASGAVIVAFGAMALLSLVVG